MRKESIAEQKRRESREMMRAALPDLLAAGLRAAQSDDAVVAADGLRAANQIANHLLKVADRAAAALAAERAGAPE